MWKYLEGVIHYEDEVMSKEFIDDIHKVFQIKDNETKKLSELIDYSKDLGEELTTYFEKNDVSHYLNFVIEDNSIKINMKDCRPSIDTILLLVGIGVHYKLRPAGAVNWIGEHPYDQGSILISSGIPCIKSRIASDLTIDDFPVVDEILYKYNNAFFVMDGTYLIDDKLYDNFKDIYDKCIELYEKKLIDIDIRDVYMIATEEELNKKLQEEHTKVDE